jgi:hypothetical protein
MRSLAIRVLILSTLVLHGTSCDQQPEPPTASELAANDPSIEGRVLVWEFALSSEQANIASVSIGSVGNNGPQPALRRSGVNCAVDGELNEGGLRCPSRTFNFEKPEQSHIGRFSYKGRNGFAYCVKKIAKRSMMQCMEIRHATSVNLAAKFLHKNIVYRQGTVIQSPTCEPSTSDGSDRPKVFAGVLISQAGSEDHLVRVDSTGWSEAECSRFTQSLNVGDSIVVLAADFLPPVPWSDWESDFEILRTLRISSQSDIVLGGPDHLSYISNGVPLF